MNSNVILIKVLLPLLMVLALSSCSQRGDKNLGITFVDNSNIYSKQFKEKISSGSFHFPNGIPVLILTVDSIPDVEIGEFANTQLDRSSQWIKSKNDQKNCLMIVISKCPRLIQIRYGENLRLEAYKAGLLLGNKYRQYQIAFSNKNNEDGLFYVLKGLEKELPNAIKLSWIMRFEKPEVKIVFKELSELATPSEGDYTKFVFKPYSNLITSVKLFSHPLILIAANALSLFILIKSGKVLIIKIFGRNKLALVILNIWNFVASIFLTIPYWGSIIFLSSFRLEDNLYARHLEIPMLKLDDYSDLLNSYTPFWFAIIIAIIVFFVDLQKFYIAFINIKWLLDSDKIPINNIKLENDEVSEVFEKAFGRAIAMIFFALFMPMAISFLVLFYNLIKLPSAILGYRWLVKMEA